MINVGSGPKIIQYVFSKAFWKFGLLSAEIFW